MELAELEEGHTLHKFNYERELSFSAAELAEAHERFRLFLLSVPDNSAETASEILRRFSHMQEETAKATGEDDRYPGPPMRCDEALVFLKAIGKDDTVLDHLGFNTALVRDVEGRIAASLRHHPLDDDRQIELQEQLDALLPTLVPPALGTASLKAIPGRSYSRGVDVTDGKNWPWWFTYESAVVNEETRLPDRTLPLQRSGYVAGMRASLGLHHANDDAGDADIASSGALAFRMFFQMMLTMPDPLGFEPCQPAMFSDGFPNLFVTNQRSNDGGRTVRLKDRSCSHHACDCGTDGLPEGVMRQRAVMSGNGVRTIRGLYLAFSRDLSRFQPPSCDEIREKRVI